MAWLTNWTYRKEITVTNALAGHTTEVLIGKTSDAVGEDVDCGGNIADDFDDLRFTAADGSTLIDYWIDSIADSGGTKLADVWVENNATPDSTLYMYYGGTETAVSSIADAFIKGDDFERGNDTDEIGGSWTEASGTVEISTGQAYGGTRSMKLVGAATSPQASIAQTAGSGYAIRFRVYKEDASKMTIYHGDASNLLQAYAAENENIYYYDTEAHDTGADATADTWELYEINDIDFVTNQNFDIWHQGAEIQADAVMRALAYENLIRLDGLNSVGADTWIDDFIIRKWAATEPSFAFGSEETEEGWSNISHVLGVAAASISHVNGVAVASISHVKGVAV